MVPLIIIVVIAILFVLSLVFHVWINLAVIVAIALITFFLLIKLSKLKYFGTGLFGITMVVFMILFYKTKLANFRLYQPILNYVKQDPNIWNITTFLLLAVISSTIILLIILLPINAISKLKNKH